MEIVAINGDEGRASANGIERTVNFFLIKDQGINLGDFVIVHVGYAIQKLSTEDAKKTWQLIESATSAPETAEVKTDA
jgi:hydrogenase expression/formation protein HypC